jgi:hypothetical protein
MGPLSTFRKIGLEPSTGDFEQFEPFAAAVNTFPKLLNIKTFISQKSLDTPVFRLIRFRQKVLTESIASVGTILP